MAEPVILYHDERMVAIDKPPGLLVHRSDLDRQATRFVVQWLRDRLGRQVYPVHRLDRATSGLLLFALDCEAASHLGRQFESSEVEKTYLAIVRGWPPESGRIDHPLAALRDERAYTSGKIQAALTDYRVLARVELPDAVDRYPSARYALLALQPLTGRRHQLRRHLKHIAHPIIGDVRYGKGTHNRYFAEHHDCRRLLLACVALVFRHPQNETSMTLRAPLSGEFAAVVQRLEWASILGQASVELLTPGA